MSHGCFISFKKEDKTKGFLKAITNKLDELEIQYSVLDKKIDSDNIDTVMSVLRTEYMNNKPVTLFLIGANSYEDTKERWEKIHGKGTKHDEYNEQSFIIRELRATLSDYDGNPRHGVVGIVMPDMVKKVYSGSYVCEYCHKTVQYVNINDDIVIREFSENYYIKDKNKECDHYSYDDRYCVLCTLDEFIKNPNHYIDEAYKKSKSELANFVKTTSIKHDYKLRDE